ncbi:SCO2400 family protein [Streptomyces avermitilis]|uniref:SCO2400 family protein n=1 Tax=Streptomyces avermitilis TaxID=33903 RepID=UPI0036771B67
MDYCSSCRRHLNGALVCPGCGAYAPDIAPATADGGVVPTWAGTATTGTTVSASVPWEYPASDTWHDGRLRDEAAVEAGLEEAPETDPYGDLEGTMPAPAPQGRAARRRQLARWKKNQRRAVVATAVALVGGGLTVAAMDRHSADQAQAATAPEVATMGNADEQVAEQPYPSSTQPGTRLSSHTPPAQSPTTDLPRRRSAAAPPRVTPPSTQPFAAASPHPTATSAAPQPRTASPSTVGTVPDGTGTAAKETSASAGADGTAPGTPQASPAPTATSPSQICLLLVCLG